jgi:hypothetical protein
MADPLSVASVVISALSVGGAVAAAKYARDSAVAARETIDPMKQMAGSMEESAKASAAIAGANASLLQTVSTATEELRRYRDEGRLIHRLEQLERLAVLIQRMSEGHRQRVKENIREAYLLEAQGEFRASLAAFSRDEFPACHATADSSVSSIGFNLQTAQNEVDGSIRDAKTALEALRSPGH